MKKTVSIVIALMLTISCMVAASATIEKVGDVTYWFPWVVDGNEVTHGEVNISDDGILKDYSSNWEIIPQNTQEKITERYLSPATVWTKDTTKEFVLAFDVVGGSKVQIGFLHVVKNDESESYGLHMVEADGSDLGEYVKLQSSKDGESWTDVAVTFKGETAANRTPVLYSAMTGYPDPVYTNVGDGTNGYDENYFIVEGVVPEDAKYVRYVYAGVERSNSWDPVVRDAAFTLAADDPDPDPDPTPDPDPDPTPPTSDMSYVYVIAAITLIGASVLVLKKRRA